MHGQVEALLASSTRRRKMSGLLRWLFCCCLVAAFPSHSQDIHLTCYNEAIELSNGSLIGEVIPVTGYGVDSPVIYSIDPDGYYQAIDGANGQRLAHGLVLQDGSLEPALKDGPRPAAKPPAQRPGRGGLLAAVCLLGEELGLNRCRRACPYGVRSYQSGACGFGASCECMEPPPPPPNPGPAPSGGFVPPWVTIPNFWGPVGSSCGVFQVCDSRGVF